MKALDLIKGMNELGLLNIAEEDNHSALTVLTVESNNRRGIFLFDTKGKCVGYYGKGDVEND